jgi:hypothetical protein
MGVSALVVAVMLAVLELLVGLSAHISASGLEHEHRLTVRIRSGESEHISETGTGTTAASSLPQQAAASADPGDRRQEAATYLPPESSAYSEPLKDWHAIANEVARASVDDYFSNDESRAAMWRQTHSIMFEPANEFVVKEEEPVISDLRFIPRIHVVGLGVTIGSCFIGIPLAGVPVEQRTVAISLVVCAKDSG